MRRGTGGLVIAVIIIAGFLFLYSHPEKITKENIAQTTIEAYNRRDEYYRKYTEFSKKVEEWTKNTLIKFGFPVDNKEFIDNTDPAIDAPTENETSSLGYISEKLSDLTENNDEAYSSSEEVKLITVIDGDTVLVEKANGQQEKVRFIGVDTPESVHADENRNNVYGDMASEYTKSLLSGYETIYLEYDMDKTDQYGRILAYVRLSDDSSSPENTVNYRLLNDGYAYDKVFLPNNKYATEFNRAREDAQSNGRGLWADEAFAALWEG